ncbi:MAG TPA: hypothetical protein VLH10_05715 [Yinghuangia sp.]|uniref:hypothetical protein n=1 Tax=Yinghuangia sp. YIM S10712 TaxID=3436930 RepID=UPI002CD8507C|nr:hypothetical protein [Yinghuangia sp.]
MIIKRLHKMGLRSEHAYTAAFASIGLTFVSWLTSSSAENVERADRWGIFIGEWAPTFFGLGLALAQYEQKAEHEQQAEARNPASREFNFASQ